MSSTCFGNFTHSGEFEIFLVSSAKFIANSKRTSKRSSESCGRISHVEGCVPSALSRTGCSNAKETVRLRMHSAQVDIGFVKY
jgi:hypothetical protein